MEMDAGTLPTPQAPGAPSPGCVETKSTTQSCDMATYGECGASSPPPLSNSIPAQPWGLSFVVTLGSGISATAVGVHLVAYASPWLPSFDLSLLLRLDWVLLGAAGSTTSPPVAAASAAGLLAAADVYGGRIPLLFFLCVATAILLFSALASSAGGTSLLGVPLLAIRSTLRYASNLSGRSIMKGAGLVSPLSALSALVQIVGLLLRYARALFNPLLSITLIPLMLLPSKSARRPVGDTKNDMEGVDTSSNKRQSVVDGTAPRLRQAEEGVECATNSSIGGSRRDAHECDSREGEMGPGCVSELDLEELVNRLENREADCAQGGWEMIVDKASSSVEYMAFRRDPQNGGATEYKTWTRFYGVSAKHVCAFYLDCDHSATYEAMIRSYDHLGFNQLTGQETGRMVKKYPLCSPREYVLGWRVWKMPGSGPTSTYFCVTKAVEHPLAPKTSSIRRVDAYRSSWRIREVLVEGVGLCAEVDIYLQEDSGMQRSMAKLAFRRSIWGFIQGTDAQLRVYPHADASENSRNLPLSVQHAKEVPSWMRRQYMSSSKALQLDEGSLSLPFPGLGFDAHGPSNKSLEGSACPLNSGISSIDTRVGGGSFLSQGRQRAGRRPVTETGAWSFLGRRALPILAAAAGIGTMTIARGPVGLAAKVLVACAVRVLAAEHNVEAEKQPLRITRQRSRSKSMRPTIKYSR